MGLGQGIDITADQRKTVLALLKRHLPDTTTWVYGSRVKWTSQPQSDLDMVVFASPEQKGRVSDLWEAFEESNLPFRVYLFVWDEVPESFRKHIEAEYVVLVEKEERSRANEWLETTLGDLIDIKHGFAFKGHLIHSEPRGEVLLTPGNFAIGGGFKGDKFKYYDGPVSEEFVLREGDLLVTMTDLSKQSDTLGYPALVPARPDGRRYLHNQRLGKISLEETSEMDLRYIHYVMCGVDYRNEVLASATGTTVKHTSPDRIKQFRFLLAPFPEQRAIAHILGTLDDKIELNRRMNETLEEMARTLFKSWFVDFDPVHAKATLKRHAANQAPRRADAAQATEAARSGIILPQGGSDWPAGRARAYLDGMNADIAALFPDSFEDSELGPIPAGWEVKPLPEIMEINPSRPLRKGSVTPYLDMANMPTTGHTPDKVIERSFGSGMRFVNGDTLLARITPCLENGKTAYVDFLEEGQVGWGSTEYIVLRPKPPFPNEFAYCLARSASFREFVIQSMTGSSGRQRVPVEALSHYLMAVPVEGIVEGFGKVVQPLFVRASNAARDSSSLSALRDTLLPNLISGELRVKSMEAETA